MNTNSINVNKYAISKMFDSESKEIYEIPKYQREYIWAGREWEALFDDLTENEEGQRLDNYLFRTLKGVPKSHVYRILRSGEVRVNKKRADQTYRLH